jgi:cellulose synthase A
LLGTDNTVEIYLVICSAGSPRVKGDDEEEDTDDLDNEFSHTDIDKQDKQQVVDEMLRSQMAYGRDTDVMMSAMQPQYPLLTNGHTVCLDVLSDKINSCLGFSFSKVFH